jgi:hypothetical protein
MAFAGQLTFRKIKTNLRGFLEGLAEECGGVFAKLAIVGAEGGEEVGVDVEFANDFGMYKDGNDDFGFGLEGAGKIAGIGRNVIDDDGFTGGSGGATDALIEGDARVRGHGAFKGTEDQDVAIGSFFEHVEANPVVAHEPFVEQSDDALHESLRRSGGGSERVQLGNKVSGLCGSVCHLEVVHHSRVAGTRTIGGECCGKVTDKRDTRSRLRG